MTDDTNQPPPVQLCTIPVEIAEQLHGHSDIARFICKLHQTADVEQPANRRISCYQIGGRGSWSPTISAASDQPWLCWRSLNHLRIGNVCAKTTMRRWGYIDNMQSVNNTLSEGHERTWRKKLLLWIHCTWRDCWADWALREEPRFQQPRSRYTRSHESGGSPTEPILVSPSQSALVGQQSYLKCPSLIMHHTVQHAFIKSTNLVQSDKKAPR